MKKKLEKNMGMLDVLSLAIGAIIGWGAFVLPGDLFIKETGVVNTFIGMSLGAMIMIIIEKNYGFLLSKDAVAGGEYAFTFKSFGRGHAIICGWFLSLAYICIVPLNATALALIAKTMFPGFLEKGLLYSIAGYNIYFAEAMTATVALIVFAWLNIKGVKMASTFQTVMTLALVGIILYMASFFMTRPEFNMTLMTGHLDVSKINIGNILRIVAIAPWAYIGFDCIPQVAEEFNFEAKKASHLAVVSIIAGLVIYTILNVITSSVFTQEMLLTQKVNWATGDAIELLFGRIGLYSLGLSLLMAIVAGINGFYMASSRLIFSMARAKAIPAWFEELDEKSKTPRNAIIFVMIMSLVAPWMGRRVLLWIVDMSSIGAAIGYLYTSLSAYVQAKKEGNRVIQATGVFGGVAGVVFMMLLLLPVFPGSISAPSYVVLIVWSVLGVALYKKYGEGYRSLDEGHLSYLILGR